MTMYKSINTMVSTGRHLGSAFSFLPKINPTNMLNIKNQTRSIVSSSRNIWGTETSLNNQDTSKFSKNLCTPPHYRCLCGTHSVKAIETCRYLSTTSSVNAQIKQGAMLRTEEESSFVKFLDNIGIIWKLRYNRLRMRNSGQNMYTSCADGTDVQQFFKACGMADAFFSWFLVTELHVWMSMLRLRQEGREGRYMIHYLVYCMWHDVEARGKAMGISSVKVKKGLKQMLYHFQAALFAYDEGILSDDRTLAAALWRTFFLKQCDDPRQVAYMVEYVRQQIQYLDTLKSAELLQSGKVKWLPLQADIPADIQEPKKVTTMEEELNLVPDFEQIKS